MSQQVQGPALAAFWCGTTGFGDQAGLRLLVQLGLCPGARPFLQRPQALFDKALAGAFDRGASDGEGGSDGAVLRTLGCFEQDTGTGHFAGRVRPTMQQVFKLLAFIVSKCDKIFLGVSHLLHTR